MASSVHTIISPSLIQHAPTACLPIALAAVFRSLLLPSFALASLLFFLLASLLHMVRFWLAPNVSYVSGAAHRPAALRTAPPGAPALVRFLLDVLGIPQQQSASPQPKPPPIVVFQLAAISILSRPKALVGVVTAILAALALWGMVTWTPTTTAPARSATFPHTSDPPDATTATAAHALTAPPPAPDPEVAPLCVYCKLTLSGHCVTTTATVMFPWR
jgi:hypothetical protein